MDIHPEIDGYIKKSKDYSIGLPLDLLTLESKFRASEELHMRSREQYLQLGLRMKEKDEIVERTRAIKKFVEENQKLAEECSRLASQYVKWKKDCSLYDRDREVLMEFGNEADERAKDAECRVKELEEELGRVLNELQRVKARDTDEVILSDVEMKEEEKLMVSVMETVLCKDEIGSSAQAFLEANIKHESFKKLHGMWNQLQPSIQMTISLIAEMKKLEKDKEHLRINLHRAEDEAIKKFVEENQKLAEECSRLASQYVKWKKDCSLYDRDREVLMEFRNEADERVKDAECRVKELEEELGRVLNELQRVNARDTDEVILSDVEMKEEEKLMVSVMETVLCKDEIGSSAQAFLEANIKHESFKKLHGMWNQLRPSIQMTISLIAEMKKLEKDKEHLRINLHRAEDEARLLSEENNVLDEGNKRLVKQLKEIRHSASGGTAKRH